MKRLERLVLLLDRFPLEWIYRGAVGYCLFPLVRLFGGEDESLLLHLAGLLFLLLALRVLLALLRKLVPVSGEIRSVWAQRRHLGKRYDSYQWRRLIGPGLGMLFYGSLYPVPPVSFWVLSLGCIGAGMVGLLVWEIRKRTDEVLRSLLSEMKA